MLEPMLPKTAIHLPDPLIGTTASEQGNRREDECLAQRIINDYPELASEVSIAFDNMLVDFDGLFPSLATEYEML